MRWPNLAIFLFTITIISLELMAVVKLYESWTNWLKDNNLTIKVKRVDVTQIKFDSYLRDFNKSYNKEEYIRRFENFKASLKEIARLNKLENNTVFGLTKFSDMSKEEFVDSMLLKPSKHIHWCQNSQRDCTRNEILNEPLVSKKYVGAIPESFDWRKKGVVKPVLNQKKCQGCWAFSIVGVLESMSAIQKNDYSSRSIQELLDCSSATNGCFNGSVTNAMNYICDQKLQFVTEEEYPLKLYIEPQCKLPKTGIYSGRRVENFTHICNMDEKDMVKTIAAHGPLIVAVDAGNWQNYMGGVITRACTRGVGKHVVQIVGYEGYDEEKTPIPYYIVRNSMGEDWGDQGYVYVAMKHGDISDVCGIAEQVTLLNVL